MKCPQCEQQQQYSYGMKCHCGYQFKLDPKNDGISDRRFVAFINGASCNGTYFFTENQLYTAACRKQLTPPPLLLWASVLVAIAIMLFSVFVSGSGFLFLLIGPIIGMAVWVYAECFAKLNRQKFDRWLEKYLSGEAKIRNMVTDATLLEPPLAEREPDIFDYGVESVLIVQREVLVDLLVANQIHATNRCVVVTGNGYPQYISVHVDRLLNESPSLPVYLLHDADTRGKLWAEEQTRTYASSQRQVIDMGLSKKSIAKIRKLNKLRLKEHDFQAPVDVVPMAMLANGIGLSMEQQTSMERLIHQDATIDSLASFG